MPVTITSLESNIFGEKNRWAAHIRLFHIQALQCVDVAVRQIDHRLEALDGFVHDFRQHADIHLSVFLYEISSFIVVQTGLYPVASFFGPDYGGFDRACVFRTDEVGEIQQRVEALQDFHVRVQINAAVVVEGVQADVVCGKSILLDPKGLLYPGHLRDVEPFQVP